MTAGELTVAVCWREFLAAAPYDRSEWPACELFAGRPHSKLVTAMRENRAAPEVLGSMALLLVTRGKVSAADLRFGKSMVLTSTTGIFMIPDEQTFNITTSIHGLDV